MNQTHQFHGFGPVIDSKSKILILGSFPSVKSRKEGFFYMHPQNRFWKILGALLSEDFVSADIPEKTFLLNKYGIALYDVIERCDIFGSEDASIANVETADIQAMIASSQIEKIFLNGRKAYALFHRYHPELESIVEVLPSSSSANASYSLEKLTLAWKIMFDKRLLP